VKAAIQRPAKPYNSCKKVVRFKPGKTLSDAAAAAKKTNVDRKLLTD